MFCQGLFESSVTFLAVGITLEHAPTRREERAASAAGSSVKTSCVVSRKQPDILPGTCRKGKSSQNIPAGVRQGTLLLPNIGWKTSVRSQVGSDRQREGRRAKRACFLPWGMMGQGLLSRCWRMSYRRYGSCSLRCYCQKLVLAETESKEWDTCSVLGAAGDVWATPDVWAVAWADAGPCKLCPCHGTAGGESSHGTAKAARSSEHQPGHLGALGGNKADRQEPSWRCNAQPKSGSLPDMPALGFVMAAWSQEGRRAEISLKTRLCAVAIGLQGAEGTVTFP